MNAINKKKIVSGQVLKASVVSRALNTSREPVLRALDDMTALGVIVPSESQGYVVAGDSSQMGHIKIVSADALAKIIHPLEKLSNSKRIYKAVEQELISHAALGRYRLNSTKLSNHFDVSRTIGNELVRLLANNGIVEIPNVGKPILPEFNSETIQNNNQVRLNLEPAALELAMQRAPKEIVNQLLADHEAAAINFDQLSFSDLSELEIALHETFLNYCGNDRMITVLRYCGIAQKFNSIYFRKYGARGNFLSEHIEILKAIQARNTDLARLLLHQHITHSTESTAARLKDFRTRLKLTNVSYLTKI